MPWLKSDDGMGEHPKTRRLIRRRKLVGLAAFGLHDLARLHASRYLTDGHVSTEFVDDVFDSAGLRPKERRDVIDALLTSGQWTEDDTDGWRIHDYLDHNPSKLSVEAKRARDAERKARGRAAQEPNGDPGPEAEYDPVSARTDDGLRADDDGNPHGVRASRPDPSRPDRYAMEEDAHDTGVEPVTNPSLPAVLAVLDSLPDLIVHPISVDHVLAAHPWADEAAAVAAAHDVGAWLTSSDPPRSRDAGTLLRTKLRKAAEQRRTGQVTSIRRSTERRLTPQEQDQAARLARMAAAVPTTTNGDRG